VAGVGAQKRIDDDPFSRMVHFGDEVVGFLLRNPHGLDVQRCAVDDGAGGTGCFYSHVEHGVLIGRHG
jgi:hypothetical protein